MKRNKNSKAYNAKWETETERASHTDKESPVADSEAPIQMRGRRNQAETPLDNKEYAINNKLTSNKTSIVK